MKANWKKKVQEQGVVNMRKYQAAKSLGTGAQVFCDSCNRDFVPNVVESKIDGAPGHTLKNFVCPHCGKMYVVTIENAETKAQAKRLRAAEQEVARVKRDIPNVKVMPKGSLQAWHRILQESEAKRENEKRRLEKMHNSLSEKFRGTFTGVE